MKPKKVIVKQAKDGQMEKLKRRINKLEKENRRLKSEIKTLEGFRDIASTYIDGKLDGVSVERVIKGISKKQTLKEFKPEIIKVCCPKCITAELKEVPYPSGIVRVCGNCDFRETVKK